MQDVSGSNTFACGGPFFPTRSEGFGTTESPEPSFEARDAIVSCSPGQAAGCARQTRSGKGHRRHAQTAFNERLRNSGSLGRASRARVPTIKRRTSCPLQGIGLGMSIRGDYCNWSKLTSMRLPTAFVIRPCTSTSCAARVPTLGFMKRSAVAQWRQLICQYAWE